MIPTESIRAKRQAVHECPPRSERLFRAFRWYARRYCRKHLRAVRLARWGPAPALTGPAVIVLNHPSWWDPLLCYLLSERLPGRIHWGVIESAALTQYKFLGRAGLFGVDSGTPRGAAQFLRNSRAILADSRATIWITGQGRFADARERPLRLRSGVGHLAAQLPQLTIVPLAIELAYWDQRTPEACLAFGAAIESGERLGRTPAEWTAAIETDLQAAQDRLASDVMSRDPETFEILVQGRAGVGGVYDGWRRMRSWLTGKQFEAAHRSD